MHTYHNASDVPSLELADCQIERLLHIRVDALGDELVEVDGTSQQLHVALLEQGLVAVGSRVRQQVRAQGHTLYTEPLVKQNAAGTTME